MDFPYRLECFSCLQANGMLAIFLGVVDDRMKKSQPAETAGLNLFCETKMPLTLGKKKKYEQVQIENLLFNLDLRGGFL